MLPMRYAPLPGGEVPQRDFDPPLPLPTQRAAWAIACEAALLFWQRAAGDKRISAAPAGRGAARLILAVTRAGASAS